LTGDVQGGGVGVAHAEFIGLDEAAPEVREKLAAVCLAIPRTT
jgi:hypothetical protein